MNIVTWDTEVFPNCFQFCAIDDKGVRYFAEISDRRDDASYLSTLIWQFRKFEVQMVGFNSLAFDYPLLHMILANPGITPDRIYARAQQIINSQNAYENMVRPSDWAVKQIDLLRIHHFDNKARMTSLKTLEFNMRQSNISDLPFPVGTLLNSEQMDTLMRYCFDDVAATRRFYNESLDKITFRQQLNQQYPGRDFTNYNDVKIGKEFFQLRLEQIGVQCYEYGDFGREPKQTYRPVIELRDCVPDFVQFEQPEFERIRQHFLATVITETKGAFTNLSATVGGLEFFFGTGGIHASVENQSYTADDETMILDVDVTSLYPSIAIEHNHYPAHLGPAFVQVYRSLREERLRHKKGTVENAALKLALNGVYGASNDKFSCFYDPLFTMKITIGGQLMLAMLAERLLAVPGLSLIQANTDGITMRLPRTARFLVDAVCQRWEWDTRLSLESVEYAKMVIADVNSYLAVKLDGSVKRKGRYEYDVDWHQDASALVVQKVAEKVLVEGAPIRETLRAWPDIMDFMLRIKANRGTVLAVQTHPIDDPTPLPDRTQRYYISEGGVSLVKIMPPLAKRPGVYRHIAVQSGWKVTLCNDIMRATEPVNIEWYANEVEKLVQGVL